MVIGSVSSTVYCPRKSFNYNSKCPKITKTTSKTKQNYINVHKNVEWGTLRLSTKQKNEASLINYAKINKS